MTFIRTERFLLVDGYNIIYAWPHLQKLAEESLETARDKLVDTLFNYQGITGLTVIVVFDAHKVKGGFGTVIDHLEGKLFSVYTKEAETADMYIERTVGRLAGQYETTVATGDYLEQIIIISKGAVRVSPAELWADVAANQKMIRERYTENRPVKNNLFLDNLDKDTAEKLERMRRGSAMPCVNQRNRGKRNAKSGSR